MKEPKKLPYVPAQPEAEVDSELRFHLDERVRANIAAGMSPDEARRAAEARFGNVAGVRDECARLLTEERKTRRRQDWFDDLRQDLRFATRSALGVRMALGSSRGAVARLVIRQGGVWMALGLLLGSAGVVASTRLVQTQLFGVAPFDPLTIGAAVVMLLICSVAALLVPVRKATRVDPITVLR